MQYRRLDLFSKSPEKSKDLALVPELPHKEYPGDLGQYDALQVERNVESLQYLLKHNSDLLSLQKYNKESQELLSQWKHRWIKELRTWTAISDAVDAEQTKLGVQEEQRTGRRKTVSGVVSPFSLFLYGPEMLDYKTPELQSLVPITSEEDKKALGEFILKIESLTSLAKSEFNLAYAPSLLYTQSFAAQGLSEKKAQLLLDWASDPNVIPHLVPDDDNEEFYKVVHKRSLKRPVKEIPGELPFGTDFGFGNRLQTSAHAFVSATLFGADVEDRRDLLEGIFTGKDEKHFIRHFGDSDDADVGYKLHVRADYFPGQKIYQVIPLVYEYCSRNGLSFKMRTYDGAEEQRRYRAFGRPSRWGPTFITIYPQYMPDIEDDLQQGFDRQLDETLVHASNLEKILAGLPNRVLEATGSDLDLHLGSDSSHRLSIRFGDNVKEEFLHEWSKKLQTDLSKSRDSSFEDAFPPALDLDAALQKIRSKR